MARVQLLQDFFPLLVFFGVYRWKDIYWATGALIVAVALQTVITYVRTKKVSGMALVSLALVVVFGGLTIALRDQRFVQWKVTGVNALFAGAFFATHVWGERPLVERMLGSQLRMDRPRWYQLNLMWGAFFVFLAVLNVVLMHTLDLDAWVKFKTFGLIGLTLAFVLAQGVWLSSRAQAVEDEPGPAPAPTEPARVEPTAESQPPV
jgi:intracellular septation protein